MVGRVFPLFSRISHIAPTVRTQLGQRCQAQIDPARSVGLVLDDLAILWLVEIAAQIQGGIGQLQRTVATGAVAETDSWQGQGRQDKPQHDGSDDRWNREIAGGSPDHWYCHAEALSRVAREPAGPSRRRVQALRDQDREVPDGDVAEAHHSGVGAQAKGRHQEQRGGRCYRPCRSSDAGDQQIGHDHDQPDHRDEDQLYAVVGLHGRCLGTHVLDARRPTAGDSARTTACLAQWPGW